MNKGFVFRFNNDATFNEYYGETLYFNVYYSGVITGYVVFGNGDKYHLYCDGRGIIETFNSIGEVKDYLDRRGMDESIYDV